VHRQARHSGPGTVLNLVSGQTRGIGDVLVELAELAGVATEIELNTSRLRDTKIRMACGNAARARELLDWMPIIPWEQTLRGVLNDWRERVGTEGDQTR
jgi:GDP-4-dehydro-6-deoxy-D-mannose reductase